MRENIDNKMIDILNNFSDGCFFVNKNMEFEFVNEVARSVIGKPMAEIINKSVWEVFPKYKDTFLHEMYNQAYKKQKVHHFEIPSSYKDVIYSIRVFPEKDGLFVIFNDITERKKEEKKLLQYNRFDAMSSMAANVAHEIRNPLTTFKGFLQLMLENKSYHPEDSLLALMIEEVGRVNEIVSQFLDLAKNKLNNQESVNLNSIIQNTNMLLETRAIKEGKYIRLNLGTIKNIIVDKNEIRQLLINLVNNALDSMTEDKMVKISTIEENEKVILMIKDQGKGISPEMIDSISEPFVTSKEHGTGLGLSICYAIAKRNNAEIEFTSNSSGTIFKVLFKNTTTSSI